jgi:hypothetical protein
MRWREPILYILFLTENESELGQLVEAIETAPITDFDACAVRDALLTDAVFADFNHDLETVCRLAAAMFAEAETSAWGARRSHLLDAAIAGLFSESVAEMCRAKISEWVPDRHGFGRSAAIEVMPTWAPTLKTACVSTLLRCLRCENEYVWRKAAEVLPIVADRNQELKARLIRLVREAPSIQTAQAAIMSLGCGWFQDQDVGEIARELRTNRHPGLCLDAIRIRAKRCETDLTDLDMFFSIAYGRDRFSSGLVARDLVDYFSLYHRDVFIHKLESTLDAQMGDRLHRQIPLVGSLIICDSGNARAHGELLQALSEDWILHDLFTQGHFPVECVNWTPDLVTKIEDRINGKDRLLENDLYWISKVLPLPAFKQKFIQNLRGQPHLGFWSSRALVEVWGKSDPEVQAVFQSMLVAEAETVAQVAEEIPLVIDDRGKCRDVLLRALRSNVSRCDFIMKGCKNLRVAADDDEVVQAALQAGARAKAPLYYDLWCGGIISAFPMHPEVRKLALEELMRRDGSLGAVAANYSNDTDMCQRALNVLCPLDDRARMQMVQGLEGAAVSNGVALDLLSAARQDTNGLVCSESTMGWVEAILVRRPLREAELDWLEKELDAVGPEFQERRTAAVIGLLLAGVIERFVGAKRYDGKPLEVAANPYLTRDDIFMRRLLPRWEELTQALGNERSAFERFEIDPERSLRVIHAGIPGADRLFAHLMTQVPRAQHVHKIDLISAVAEMAPRSDYLRELITSLLLNPYEARTVGDHWAELRAGEIFAEHFRGDSELLGKIVDAFKTNPNNGAAAGTLAEFLLREDDAVVGKLLADGVQGRSYAIGTHFKLIAALSPPESFIGAIEEWLMNSIDPDTSSMPYWVPALLRRIKIDSEIREKMLTTLAHTSSVSSKLTFASMLSVAIGPSEQLKQYASDELQKLELGAAPAIGFDLASYVHRPLFQLLKELAAY